MYKHFRKFAAQVQVGRIPYLGQITAVVAVAYLSWLLFAALFGAIAAVCMYVVTIWSICWCRLKP